MYNIVIMTVSQIPIGTPSCTKISLDVFETVLYSYMHILRVYTTKLTYNILACREY